MRVIQDDSWSTDKITAAGREKLRAAGFAPPAPREASAPRLVQLQSNVFRCPYCGSTRDEAREHLRPDAMPLAALLRELPAAVRAIQDDLAVCDFQHSLPPLDADEYVLDTRFVHEFVDGVRARIEARNGRRPTPAS